MVAETRKAVLLTGGTGFVGAALLRALMARSVPVVLLLRSGSDTWRIADLLGTVSGVRMHALDEAAPEAVFQSCDVGAVVHVATAYGRNGERLSDLVAANVSYPLRLLQGAADAGVGIFVNTDTFSCKGAVLPEGLAGYVLTKRQFRECADLLAGRRGLPLVHLRIEHAYGPGDGRDKFVPGLLRALLAGVPSFDLTPGQQVRDFVHVDDVVAAYLSLLEHGGDVAQGVQTLDVGTGTGHTVEELARLARELCGASTELRFGALPYRPGELMRSVADTRPLRELGWAPHISLQDGLARTIQAAGA
jgi:nucleoside-diphosphate-sugar epimerase